MKMIETRNLRVGYPKGRKHDLQIGPEFNVDAHAGELIALIGQNGSGKSTFLRTLARIQPLLKGTILLKGTRIEEINNENYSTLLSYVSTEPVRTLNLTVDQLVSLGRFPYTNWFGHLTESDLNSVDEAVKLTHIENLRYRLVHELSDGERQRAMIARTLAQDTPIIILDEPTAYLDIISRHDIVHLLADLAHTKNKTILFSTHDLSLALAEADKIWLLQNNNVVQGSPEDLIFENAFEGMFGNNLEFDWITGSLKRIKKAEKTVIISGARSLAYDLTVQALEKAGYSIGDKSDIKIEIINSNKLLFRLTDSSGTSDFNSIYDLCRKLK